MPVVAALLFEFCLRETRLRTLADRADRRLSVLRWLYRAEGWFVAPDLTMFHDAIQNSQQMISPDIAVFKGITVTAEEWEALKSWDMRGGQRACPPVMLEVSSEGTWQTDIRAGRRYKPVLYGRMGVRE